MVRLICSQGIEIDSAHSGLSADITYRPHKRGSWTGSPLWTWAHAMYLYLVRLCGLTMDARICIDALNAAWLHLRKPRYRQRPRPTAEIVARITGDPAKSLPACASPSTCRGRCMDAIFVANGCEDRRNTDAPARPAAQLTDRRFIATTAAITIVRSSEPRLGCYGRWPTSSGSQTSAFCQGCSEWKARNVSGGDVRASAVA